MSILTRLSATVGLAAVIFAVSSASPSGPAPRHSTPVATPAHAESASAPAR